MTKERLFFKGVSEIVGTEDLGLLILTNESCERQITIVCDKAMAVQLELRIKNIPVTKIMFPEVLCKLLKANTAFNYELVMDDIIDGQYRTILYDKDTMEPTVIRASDAVLLSLVGPSILLATKCFRPHWIRPLPTRITSLPRICVTRSRGV